MTASAQHGTTPRTAALAHAFTQLRSQAAQDDLLFLEAWEMRSCSSLGATLRAQQLRRANPDLAAAIRAELHPQAVAA